MIAKSRHIDKQYVLDQILKLSKMPALSQPLEMVSIIKNLVPEYISNNSTFEVLDDKK